MPKKWAVFSAERMAASASLRRLQEKGKVVHCAVQRKHPLDPLSSLPVLGVRKSVVERLVRASAFQSRFHTVIPQVTRPGNRTLRKPRRLSQSRNRPAVPPANENRAAVSDNDGKGLSHNQKGKAKAKVLRNGIKKSKIKSKGETKREKREKREKSKKSKKSKGNSTRAHSAGMGRGAGSSLKRARELGLDFRLEELAAVNALSSLLSK